MGVCRVCAEVWREVGTTKVVWRDMDWEGCMVMCNQFRSVKSDRLTAPELCWGGSGYWIGKKID